MLFQSVKQNALPHNWKNLELKISTLKSHLASMGAAVSALDMSYESY
jgi:hypothetical protein